MTSLVFMLVLVPAPPWITPTTNWSCSCPAMISVQTSSICFAFRASSTPICTLARAAACFTCASATTNSG